MLAAEKVSRFIFDRNGYASSAGRVKYNSLMPNPAGETSVFKITTLTLDEVWDIGEDVAAIRGRTLKARGDILSLDVSVVGLEIESDTQSHPLHANIIGWPTERDKKLLIAKKLAVKAELHVKST